MKEYTTAVGQDTLWHVRKGREVIAGGICDGEIADEIAAFLNSGVPADDIPSEDFLDEQRREINELTIENHNLREDNRDLKSKLPGVP